MVEKKTRIERNESVLGRWSRRKRGSAAPVVAAPAGAERPKPESEPEAGSEVEVEIEVATLVEGPAPSLPDKAGPGGAADPASDDPPAPLPDIDSLDADSDYTPFLGKDVPEKLARKALRKLWLGDPTFNFRDGLDDYDENFRAYFTEAIAKTVKTVYQVAKGAAKEDEPATTAVDETTVDDHAAEPESPEPESPKPESPEPTPVASPVVSKQSDDGDESA